MKDSWNAAYQGSANAHKIAVLEEGMKYTPIGIAPEQAQFLETRKFQINEIARIFRVPPHMLADLEKSSFSNIEQQSLEYVKYTLDPWVVRWEQSMCRALFSESEKPVVFYPVQRGRPSSRRLRFAHERVCYCASERLDEHERHPRVGKSRSYRAGARRGFVLDQRRHDKTSGRRAVRRSTAEKGGFFLKRFWNWVRNEDGTRILTIDGVIAEESWFDDDVTPKLFRQQLNAGQGRYRDLYQQPRR